MPDAVGALALVLVASFLVRALWLNLPGGSLIFDETYYVNAARVILGWHVAADAPYATAPPFLDPNTEHPPLGKLLMAGSMAVFGDAALGWRAPSLVAALVASVAIVLIVRDLGRQPWLATLVAAIYALDVLSFIHGRIGTLDMMALAASLMAMWLCIRRRWVLSGAGFGIAALIKVSGIYGLFAALLWLGIGVVRRVRLRAFHPRQLLPAVVVAGSFAVVWLAGLWFLDARFTSFASPIDHLARIFGYGLALQARYSPTAISSEPWEWPAGLGQFDYLKAAVNTVANGTVIDSRPIVEFRAAINPVLIGGLTITLTYGAWRAWSRRDRLAAWALIWAAANFLPYVALVLLSNRVTYLFYFLPVVPSLAVLAGVFLIRSGLPRAVTWGYLAATLIAFVAYFPFRQLPA
jgi:predicted membrane-bound dolichyl-phosphate-mannose-protein mannosyltransferase